MWLNTRYCLCIYERNDWFLWNNKLKLGEISSESFSERIDVTRFHFKMLTVFNVEEVRPIDGFPETQQTHVPPAGLSGLPTAFPFFSPACMHVHILSPPPPVCVWCVFESTSWHAIRWSKYVSTHTPRGFTASSQASALKVLLAHPICNSSLLLHHSCFEQTSDTNKQSSWCRRSDAEEHGIPSGNTKFRAAEGREHSCRDDEGSSSDTFPSFASSKCSNKHSQEDVPSAALLGVKLA